MAHTNGQRNYYLAFNAAFHKKRYYNPSNEKRAHFAPAFATHITLLEGRCGTKHGRRPILRGYRCSQRERTDSSASCNIAISLKSKHLPRARHILTEPNRLNSMTGGISNFGFSPKSQQTIRRSI